jgi:hypothetical protein
MSIALGFLSLGQVSLIANRSDKVASGLIPKQKQSAQVSNEVNLIASDTQDVDHGINGWVASAARRD